MEFATSFKPLFTWLKILLGIDLDRSNGCSRYERWVLLIYSLILLICVHIILGSIQSYDIINTLFVERKSPVQTFNHVIHMINKITSSVLIHICFFGDTFKKWTSLWNRLQEINGITSSENRLYRRLRHLSTAAVVLLLVVCSIQKL